jgi:hypothetical protein
MDIGLLWFDNDPKVGLEEKVRRAAGRYQEKFGHAANVCFLNPGAIAGRSAEGSPLEVEVGGAKIKVLAARQVLPHHFWVGVSVT